MEITTLGQLREKRIEHENLAKKNNIIAVDVAKKMEIARNILIGLEKRLVNNITDDNNIIKEITGVKDEILKEAYENLNKVKHHTFQDVFDECKEDNSVKVNLNYKDLREVIFNLYIKKRVIPTADKMLNALKEKMSRGSVKDATTKDGEDLDRDVLVRVLTSKGFKWKQVPNSSKCIIIEEPEQIYKRTMYLQKIKEYRNDKRCIVYIQCTASNIFAASPLLGLLNKSSKSSKHGNSTEHWAIEKLLTVVPKASVMVVSASNELLKCKKAQIPTADSTKVQMMDWLSNHSIAYSKSYHRAELLKLIETYKSTCPNMTVLEAVFKSHGHEMLVTPPELSCLDYFEFLFDLEKNGMDIHAAVTALQPEDWQKLGVNLEAAEDHIYEEDMKFEIIVDQLLTMAKFEGIDDSEMDTYVETKTVESLSKIISF